MKRILLLFSRSSHEYGLSDPEHLTELLRDTNEADFEYAYFDELSFYIDEKYMVALNAKTGKDLDEYDAVYLRHWGDEATQSYGLAVARYCKFKGIPFVDREAWRVGSFNKLTQYINLHEAGIPIPRTLMARGHAILDGVSSHAFTYPIVLKATKGTRGADNFKISDRANLELLVNNYPVTTFVAQQYIENEGDYRIIVAGSTVQLAIKRTAPEGSHLNNTSQGGKPEIVEVSSLPEVLRKDSIAAARFFGRDFAGVDMVIDVMTGKHYCFEVNRAPQIEHSSFEQKKAAVLAKLLTNLDV